MALFKLPRLKANLAVVNKDGKPTDFFLRLFNIDFAQRIEANENAQNQTIEDLAGIVAQLQAINESAQAAASAANEAQASADAAAGGMAVSGSASDPAVDLIGSGWVLGPVVSLTGVAAGDLTISGSGPQQDSDVDMSGAKGGMSCNFRIVEVVGGVDTVVFTGNFQVFTLADGSPATVTNQSSSSVSSFVSTRTSTGAVDYRIDARGTGARDVTSLLLYIYARRA